jgi:hypothetical protein
MVVGIVAAAGALSACGGGTSLSKAEYVKKAKAICDDTSGWVTSPKPNTVTLSPSFEARWDDMLKRLRKLRAPKGDGEQVAKIWDEADQAFATWADEVKSQGEAKAVDDESVIFKRAASLATTYGIDCGM